MIKRYYMIIKKYFGLGANNKKLLIHLFISSFLRRSEERRVGKEC